MQSARGIKDYDIISVILCMSYCLFGNFHRVALAHFKNRCFSLCADNLQLLYSSRSVHVAGNKQRTSALLTEHFCKLCAVCGLT